MTLPIIVSDHALVRYLDRVMGLDVEAVRTHIANVCHGVVTARCVKAEGADFIIKNQTVVTARPRASQNPRKVPRGREYAEATE